MLSWNWSILPSKGLLLSIPQTTMILALSTPESESVTSPLTVGRLLAWEMPWAGDGLVKPGAADSILMEAVRLLSKPAVVSST